MVSILSRKYLHWSQLLVPLGFVLGSFWDSLEDQKLTGFRNKSALFQRELKPGEEYTWK